MIFVHQAPKARLSGVNKSVSLIVCSKFLRRRHHCSFSATTSMLRNPAFHLVLAPTRFLDLPCIHNANFYLFPGLTSLSSEMGAPFPMNVLLRLTFYSIVLYMITVSAFNSQVIPPSSFVKELNVWTFRGSIGDGRCGRVNFLPIISCCLPTL